MKDIIATCEPRADILEGTFNPEIFTASLNAVIQYYQTNQPGVHSIYTDAEQFFTAGTYATEGFKQVLSEVFARLAGDGTAPAIHRLETAFGGGKTHTLIACTHIGYQGDALKSCLKDLVASKWLPPKGEIDVVGISGIDIPVHNPKGTQLIPYTLWGEIAYQIGGRELYKAVEADAAAHAAPGKNYFETVFKGRKVLVMIDELAQYAARLSAARADGSEQLAAFLLALHDYARSHAGISIIFTLASTTDAFARQTEQLAGLLAETTGREVTADDALSMGDQAIQSIASVVARDATSVVPVQASEISRVLAKRLFVSIDHTAAAEIAAQYGEMYRNNSDRLPERAVRSDFYDSLIAHYPFHPTFIDFLNNKLAAYENFQGTRGVLRVLALAVRNLWQKQARIPMIHACHLDMRNPRIVNEVVGRTGSGDLLAVLNADVGGADTDTLTGGISNAQEADRRNPHPEGYPLYEYTWKTVFLHSLVGRDKGLGSNIFGLTEQDALFDVSFPGLTPPQAVKALEEIQDSAFYLRFDQGRYYASLDPSVNIALAKIRRGLQSRSVRDLLDATARKVVSETAGPFTILTDVTAPEHIDDKTGKPVLALIALNADAINVPDFVTTAGPNRPRIEQNLVFLLVPETVKAKTGKAEQQSIDTAATGPDGPSNKRHQLHELARWVLAMRELKKNPQNYSISPQKLTGDDFHQRHTERENALISRVTETYRYLWYPSASGQIVCKEIRTAGGEGGAAVMEQIKQVLLDDNELITGDHTTQADLTSLGKLFFGQQDIVEIATLRNSFCRIRKWPILAAPEVLAQVVRAGVSAGKWCLFRMGKADATVPEEIYSRETGEVPLSLDIDNEYALVTPAGARQRGWGKPSEPDMRQLQDKVWDVARQSSVSTVSKISDKLADTFGDVPAPSLEDALLKLIQANKLFAFKGDAGQQGKPELIKGAGASFYVPDEQDVIITPSQAAQKGWVDQQDNTLRFSGKEGAERIMPLLKRLGSIYAKGGKTRIDVLDLTDMALPDGGTLRMTLENASPETIQLLSELFETIDGLVSVSEHTGCDLTIYQPENDCPFVKALQKDPNKDAS
ncbi:MAG: DUF499 domain-containing protein [Thermodesulfobacteriota bacterium]|nr:DUF499 domain-containing protein [Thermodesulfobacteriota bacterium]